MAGTATFEKITKLRNEIATMREYGQVTLTGDDLARKEYELEKAERDYAIFEALPEDQKLAFVIHEKQCHWNHTDGCAWFYAKDNDPETWVTEFSHVKYLEKAHNVLAVADFTDAMNVLQAL